MDKYDKSPKYYQPRTVKLEKEDDHRLEKVCELNNVKVSTFMRAAILEKLNSGAISNIAGQNKIHYNSENDTFRWIIETDSGKEVEVLRNLNVEFVNDLLTNIQFEINKRNEIIGKKKKQSVSVPKSLLRK